MTGSLQGWQEYADPQTYDPTIVSSAAPVQAAPRSFISRIGDFAEQITPLIGGVEEIVRAARNLPGRETGSGAYRMAGEQLGEFMAAAQRAYEQNGHRARSVVPPIEEEGSKPTDRPSTQDEEALQLQRDLSGVLTPRLSVLFR